MNFEFMTIDTPLPPCMPFPRALTGFPVSSTAKVMYCRMLDTMLSKIFVVPGTLTIFSHRVTVVRVLGSKFLLYHFGIKAVIILKYHGALIEPVYPIKEPASLSPWRFKFHIH